MSGVQVSNGCECTSIIFIPRELTNAFGSRRGSFFADLAGAFAGIDAHADPDAYTRLIGDFDRALDAAVANDHLTSALRTVRTHLVRVRRLARDRPDRVRASVTEHRLIASAIAQRDADLAAHATHVHLHNALEGILGSLPATVSERLVP